MAPLLLTFPSVNQHPKCLKICSGDTDEPTDVQSIGPHPANSIKDHGKSGTGETKTGCVSLHPMLFGFRNYNWTDFAIFVIS